MTTFPGTDFVFVSDEAPEQVIKRFMQDHNLTFDQALWEYPWSVEDAAPRMKFTTFESLLAHVLSQENPEYAFYPKGDLDCRFVLAKNYGLTFIVQYSGETPEALAEFAQRYGGKYGFVSISDAPVLEGIKSFKRSIGAVTKRFDDFVLIQADWVYENCHQGNTNEGSDRF